MTRMIDGDAVKRRIWGIVETWKYQGRKYDALLLESVIAQIVDTQPTLTPPNEWVSVEDRLPEVGQEVLVYWRNTSQKAEHFELTHYDGDHWFLLDNTERPWIVVVAWMPLPAPPDRRPPEGEEDT